jgi:hypothetical protein
MAVKKPRCSSLGIMPCVSGEYGAVEEKGYIVAEWLASGVTWPGIA